MGLLSNRSFRFFAVLFVLLNCSALLGQTSNVGIGTTTPNSSALLELSTTSKGLLIPRMTQAQRDLITTPATGLLIYATDSVSPNRPATFYYYTGTVWVPFLSSSTGWLLTGNSGTTPTSNYLGTSDAQDLVFKTNATERMRTLSTGNIGVGTTTPAGVVDIGKTIPAAASTSAYTFRVDPTLSGALATAQTGLYGQYTVPTVNLTGGVSNTVTSLYNGYHGLTATAGTITSYYGDYIAAPTGTGTITNKYALVTEASSGNVGIGTTTPSTLVEIKDGNVLLSNSGTADELRFAVPGGTTYSGFKARAQGNGTINYLLPDTLASDDAELAMSNGSGTMRWRADHHYNLYYVSGGNGTKNNYSLSANGTFFVFSTTGALTLSGIAANSSMDGRMIMICNGSSNNLTLMDDGTTGNGSTIGNRITSGGHANVTLTQDRVLVLVYDANFSNGTGNPTGVWRIVG